ncbi:hypothetical protein [Frigoriglobus tundricola]|uniref:Uncharacterized protein n=1 Tax=Frigoriglobus tundricola TaxID=2774151 RepID=A0A6M5YMM3_9BACT|nr:hypothetical protein [Frigoriglobus tundricola]QJW95178.1 hypothetical protein FTUN_2717 [Frigoriglobus tundricola]
MLGAGIAFLAAALLGFGTVSDESVLADQVSGAFALCAAAVRWARLARVRPGA